MSIFYLVKLYWQIYNYEYNTRVKIYSLSSTMSVASRTKTKMFTTVVLGFVAALSILPTWASTTPGVIPLTTVNPVVSTSSKQDLSELRARLKDRFSWVATEVRSLIDWTIVSTSTGVSDDTSVRIVDASQWIWVKPVNSRQDVFGDIQDDPYKSYINRLSAYDVLNTTSKFFPQNYFLIDDFIVLFNKLYKKTTGQSLDSQELLSITSPDWLMTKWLLQKIMYLAKNVDYVTINGNPYDKLIRSEWAYYLVRIFDVPWLNADEENIDASEDAQDHFTDVDTSPFASDINTLVDLGIVTTQTNKFYPNNYLRHYDFVVMLVNSFLVSQNQKLSLLSWFNQFSDVDSSASYLPQLTYSANRWLIDRLTTTQQWNLYFQPNKFLTKHDVYHILPKVLNIQFIHNDQEADSQKMSRGEFAKLLVDGFQLVSKQSSGQLLSWNNLGTWDLSVLMKLKTLLSLL